jgi:hypothetical protein
MPVIRVVVGFLAVLVAWAGAGIAAAVSMGVAP